MIRSQNRQVSQTAHNFNHGLNVHHWNPLYCGMSRPCTGEPDLSDAIKEEMLDSEEVTRLREKHYNATIIQRIDVHSELARFRIRPDDPIVPFEAGQYVALGLG